MKTSGKYNNGQLVSEQKGDILTYYHKDGNYFLDNESRLYTVIKEPVGSTLNSEFNEILSTFKFTE